MIAEEPRKVTVRVYHDYYGCDTGCCGHTVEITMSDGDERVAFDFDHPHGDKATHADWARKWAEDVIRRNWPKCLDSIDWDSMQVEDVDRGCPNR